MLRRILAAGLFGGLVDFVYATCVGLIRSGSPLGPWQGVASGWLGPTAREMGLASAGLGVLTHFAIALVMAAAYAAAATRLSILYRRPWACGPVYGLILYAVMYGAVLPLRFGRPWHWAGLLSVTDILAHVGVALVIAAVLSRGKSLTRQS